MSDQTPTSLPGVTREDRPLADAPEWLLEYFAPCITFGVPYRRELCIRRSLRAGKGPVPQDELEGE